MYTCIHSPPNFPPIWAATYHWAEFTVIYIRTSMVTHLKYSNVYMSILNYLTLSSLHLPLGNHKFRNKLEFNRTNCPILQSCKWSVLFIHGLSCFSHVWPFATPWTIAHQAPLSMGFSRQKYWRGLPCPPPWNLPNPGTGAMSLMSLALAVRFFTSSTTWDTQVHV